MYEEHGLSIPNCPISPTMMYHFTPFTKKEIKNYSGANQECIESEILLPRFISMQAPIGTIQHVLCSQLESMFHKFRSVTANRPDDLTRYTLNLINAASNPDQLSSVQQTVALNTGLFFQGDNAIFPAYPKHQSRRKCEASSLPLSDNDANYVFVITEILSIIYKNEVIM